MVEIPEQRDSPPSLLYNGLCHDIAPLERATKGVIVTQYDKDAAEAVGLIKIAIGFAPNGVCS